LCSNKPQRGTEPAIVYSEASLTGEKPEGQNGKSLCVTAVSKIVRTATIDGKSFDGKSNFDFQTIGIDTKLVFFDDLKKHFDFRRLFSAITGGYLVEKKHKQPFQFLPEENPKTVLTTNYAVPDVSSSERLRIYQMELFPFYNSEHKPIDDFQQYFFYDWNYDNWNEFYSFMAFCISLYLEKGLTKYSSDTLIKKKILNVCDEIVSDFLEIISLTLKPVLFHDLY
jgi:hypothetical protein